MKYFAFKNTNSSTGADFAPSSRSAVNSSADNFISDTAVAVSVLFLLIMAKAVIMGLGMLICLIIALIMMRISATQSKPQ